MAHDFDYYEINAAVWHGNTVLLNFPSFFVCVSSLLLYVSAYLSLFTISPTAAMWCPTMFSQLMSPTKVKALCFSMCSSGEFKVTHCHNIHWPTCLVHSGLCSRRLSSSSSWVSQHQLVEVQTWSNVIQVPYSLIWSQYEVFERIFINCSLH